MSASSEFLARTMVKTDPSPLPGGEGGSARRKHKETLSPFDSTTYKGKEMPGQHPQHLERISASETMKKSIVSPKSFLKSHSGLGGTINMDVAKAAESKRTAGEGSLTAPPKSGAKAARPNPPNTELRRVYERSDLPLVIIQGARCKLQWKVEIPRLDFHHYLPLFFTGLREVEEPFRFIAEEGTYDLMKYGGEAKVLPVVPQLIMPLKEAMNTRDERIMIRALRVLQAMINLGDHIGVALVPYYRQLLPIMNVYVNATANLGDKIDYHQRFGRVGELIRETLELMELRGGPDAFINIRYLIPTYQSVC